MWNAFAIEPRAEESHAAPTSSRSMIFRRQMPAFRHCGSGVRPQALAEMTGCKQRRDFFTERTTIRHDLVLK
jgi:hypothetical protein